MAALREKQDILVAAITKAQKNGYVVPDFVRGVDIEIAFPAVIFNREFAKAFWPDGEISYWVEDIEINKKSIFEMDKKDILAFSPLHMLEEQRVKLEAWELHIAYMAIAPSAVEYLESFLNEEEYPL